MKKMRLGNFIKGLFLVISLIYGLNKLIMPVYAIDNTDMPQDTTMITNNDQDNDDNLSKEDKPAASSSTPNENVGSISELSKQEVNTKQEEIPKKDETPKQEEPVKQEEPSKQDETPKQDDSPKKEEATKQEETSKQDETLKQDNNSKQEESPKQEEPVKQEEPSKEDETPKQDDSSKKETTKQEETSKQDETLKQDNNSKQEESSKQEDTAKQEDSSKQNETPKQEDSSKKEEATKQNDNNSQASENDLKEDKKEDDTSKESSTKPFDDNNKDNKDTSDILDKDKSKSGNNELDVLSTDSNKSEKSEVNKDNLENNDKQNVEKPSDNEETPKKLLRNVESHDLTGYITSVTIGAPKNDEGEYQIFPGSNYNVVMHFAETLDNQFPNGDVELKYILPEGFDREMVNDGGTFSINVVTPDGIVTVNNNNFVIDKGVLTMTWSQDPEVHSLFAANNANFFVRFEGSFDGSKDIINYNDFVVTPMDYDGEESSLEMTKISSAPDLTKPPYPENPTIDYIISLNSTGTNTDISVSDTITGNGVTLDPSNIIVSSDKPINYTINVDESNPNKFTFEADKMVNGQTVTISYSAKLNEKLAIRDGDNSFYINAHNEALLKTDGQDDITVEKENKIKINPYIEKVGTIVDGELIKWVVNINVNNKLLVKGMPVIDSMKPGSEEFMQYYGAGITVNRYDSNNDLIDSTPITWSQLTSYSGTEWIYTIPNDDNYYRYEIVYNTTYNHEGSDVDLENDVDFGDSKVSESVHVQGDHHVDFEKEAIGVDLESEQKTVTWLITIHVPSMGLDSTNNTFTETYPSKYLYPFEKNVVEPIIIDSVEVEGLNENETYTINPGPTSATFSFFKDGVPGLASASYQRTIKITLKTIVDEDWLKAASNDNYFIEHRNTFETVTGVAEVTYPKIIKSVTGVDAEEKPLTATINGVQYPLFKYTILTELLGDDNFQLDDKFDTDLFRMYEPTDPTDTYLILFGGDTVNNQTHIAGDWNHIQRIDYANTATGIKFLIAPGKVPKNDKGELYNYYLFSYYLIPKNYSSFNELMQRAATSENATYTFSNSISYNDKIKGSVEGTYKYEAFDKKITGYDKNTGIASFEIDINPDDLILNDMGTITLVDKLENLSLIYDSIVVTPSDGVIYDTSGNNLTFTLPDSKSIRITYNARVNFTTDEASNVEVTYKNTATLIAGDVTYTKEVKDTVKVESHGGGSASIYHINLIKYEAGNMGKRLSGAVFELLDNNKKNVLKENGEKITFVSGENGKIFIMGDQAEDGWSLLADTKYYLHETKAPKGYMLSDFLYEFTISSNGKTDYDHYIYYSGDTMTAKNYPGTDIFVEKDWEDGLENHSDDVVTVMLQKKVEGSDEWVDVKSAQLNEENEWHYEFRKLPLVETIDDEDLHIEYRIIETHVNDVEVDEDSYEIYQSETSEHTLIILNKTELKGEIKFSGEKLLPGKKIDAGDFSFELYDEDNKLIETVQNDANGKFEFSKIFYTGTDLKKDSSGKYIPTTKKYSIKEVIGQLAGVVYDKTVHSIIVTLTYKGNGVIEAVSDPKENTFKFENKYETKGEITFSGEKKLPGKKLAAGMFSFELYDNNNQLIETVQNDANGKFSFTKLNYTESDLDKDTNGIYIPTTKKYSIKEVIGNLAGVVYDTTIHNIIVTLTDDGNGKINTVSDPKETSFVFENKYETKGDITFSGEKKLPGKKLEAGMFSFELYDEDDKLIETVQNDANGKFTFSKISYTESDLNKDTNGIYVETTKKYTIKEVIGDLAGVVYDTTIHNIVVTLTDDGNGKINAVSDPKENTFKFENKYETKGDITFSGEKKLPGKKLEAGAFSFELYDEDDKLIETVQNDANGKFSFTKLNYTESDLNKDTNGIYIPTTKKYSIKEVIGNLVEVVYDTTIHNIVVTLTDDGNGKINAVSDPTETSFKFENKYETKGDITFSGEKKLPGKKLEAGAFSFELYDEDDKLIETVQNDVNGKFTFSKISYTESDLDKDTNGIYVETTKKYTIKEVIGDLAGVVYDTTIHNIVVTLTDDGNGKINAVSDPTETSFVFENKYETKGEAIISVAKELVGRNWNTDDEFEFTISSKDGSPLPDVKTIKINKNSNNYKSSFDKIEFTKAGTYTYIISETHKGETINGTKYDLEDKTITFTLKDDGNGHLVLDTGVDPTFEVKFTNEYIKHVSVSKVDIADGKELVGAKIQLLDKNGDVVEEWTSTKEAHILEGLVPNQEYTLKEIMAPKNYKITADIKFVIDENGNVTTTGNIATDSDGNIIILVEDEMIKVNVNVSKVDIANGKELEGATLQVIDKDGNVVEEWVSTKDIHVVYGLEANEEYTLKETVAPEGYVLASDITFVVDENGKVTTTGKTSTDSEGNAVILVENKKTQVVITKVDITTGKELEGATLQVLDKEGNVLDEWISTKEGHVIEGLKVNEIYILKETVAPDGYVLTTDVAFTFDETGEVSTKAKTTTDSEGNTVILIENKMTKIVITKVDITTGKEVEGAKLQLLDKDGNVLDEWISTKEGHVIEGLKVNEEYTLKEIVAPLGYDIASDTKFTIDENGHVITEGTTSTDNEGNVVILVKDSKIPDNPPTRDNIDFYIILLNLFIIGFTSCGIYLRKLYN